MQKIQHFICVLLLLVTTGTSAQNIGIGTSKPHKAARLEVASDSSGILIPRVTHQARLAIADPPAGLLVYQADKDSVGFWYYQNGWQFLKPANVSANKTSGAIGFWDLQGNENTDTLINFLGTTDNKPILFRTNDIKRATIDTNGSIVFHSYLNSALADSILTTDSTGRLMLVSSASSSVFIADSISHLEKYNGIKEVAFIKDSLRGGLFCRYAGNSAADSGMVFLDSLERKWIRHNQQDYVDIRWYGASAEGWFQKDNYPYIMKAIAFCIDTTTAFPSARKRLYIPAAKKEYYCTQTIELYGPLEIVGQPGSTIAIQSPNKGIVSKFPYTLKISNLALLSNAPYTGNVDTFHAFTLRGRCIFDNVTANNFPGDGFNLEADLVVPPNAFNYGNVNTSVFNHCHSVSNRRNGFRLKGGDANSISFYACEAVSNGALGVDDQSFLGNNYHSFHSASNGSPELPWHRGLAKLSGRCFAAIKDSLLPAPLSANWEDYWVEVPAYWANFAYVQDYSASKIYYTTGAYNLNEKAGASNENQLGTLIGCYSESDQAPSYVGQRCLIIGGDHGAGIRKGPYLHSDAGSLKTPNSVISYNPQKNTHFGAVNKWGFVNAEESALGVAFGFDTTYNVGTVKPYSGYEAPYSAGVAFGLPNTVPGKWGRQTNDLSGRIISPAIFLGNKDNPSYTYIRPAFIKPTTPGTNSPGDLIYSVPSYYFHEKNDVFGWRLSPINAQQTQQWVTLKTDNEFAFTTTSNANYEVENHYYLSIGFRYEIDIICSDNLDNYWTEKRTIVIGKNSAGNAYIRDEQYENKYMDAALSAAKLQVVCSAANIFLRVNGLSNKTLNWKLQIKRITL